MAPDLKVIKLDNFSFVLGTDSIGGTAAVNLSSEKPEITANLNSDHLDLRPVLAQQEQKSSTTEKKPGKVFPATSLPLDGLNAANAAIDLEIKQLLLPKSAMNNLKTKVSLKNGHLMIKPLLADIGGGKLAVELNLKTNNKAATIDTKLKVDQLDLGSMLKENDIMIVDTPRMTIIGVGQIDLKTEKLDFGIKPQPKEGLGTKETGKLSISLKELTNLFRLSGTLSNPLLGISTEETLKSVAKTGFALLTGPVGMAKLFISGSSGSENPCATALKIAAKGPAASKETAGKKKDTKKSVEKKTKGIGNKILDVFKGKQ